MHQHASSSSTCDRSLTTQPRCVECCEDRPRGPRQGRRRRRPRSPRSLVPSAQRRRSTNSPTSPFSTRRSSAPTRTYYVSTKPHCDTRTCRTHGHFILLSTKTAVCFITMSGSKNQGGWGTRKHTGFRAETKWYGLIGGGINVRRCFYACCCSFFGHLWPKNKIKANVPCRGDENPTTHHESLRSCH